MQTQHKVDDFGNKLTLHNTGQVHLHLKGESRPRFIGKFVKEKHVWHYEKRIKEEHRMIKNDSWGLNWSLIEKMDPEAIVTLITEKARYSIRVRDARDKGEFLHFKTQGFERQFFVPLKEWTVTELT